KCTISSLLREIFRYKRLVFLGQLIAIVTTVLITIVPLFIPFLVDELLLGKDGNLTKILADIFGTLEIYWYVLIVLVTILVLRLLATLLGILQTKIFVTIAKKITFALRLNLLNHLQNVSLKEYEGFSVGSMTSKLVTDIETLDGFIGTTVSKLIIAFLTLLFSSIILMVIHWQLAIFILLTNPLVVYFTAKLSRKIGILKKEENRAVGEFQGTLSDTLELFHQIKATNKERYFFDVVRTKTKELKDYAIAFGYKSDVAMKWSFLLFLSGYEVFRAVSILAVAYSDLSVGLMFAVFSYLWVMVGPTQDIINFQYTLATAKSACARIDEIYALEQEATIANPKNPFLGKKNVSIKIQNLFFSYNGTQQILKDISLEIKPGEKVAIVGSSGSGKSTLANIIVGFYPVKEGSISYDGVLAKDTNLSLVRENIHLILQQPKLFNDTIRFNLTLGAFCSEDQIRKAIEIAQLDEVVAQLKDGLDTIVGRDGIKLSGGQRQRIAIARMLLSNPKVVIFDESTSALDTHTEWRLFGALKEFLDSKTVIIIAHRLSTIKNVDKIYVLEDGFLVDSGTPNELLAKESSYLATMQ
ncbi:MAG TPA: ABC transporter ATP-binding protein, partial [Epsilonproteobacteria bacterium]|nr:ABC transporter ATP-binding protein [Campylobacterota bacterium]